MIVGAADTDSTAPHEQISFVHENDTLLIRRVKRSLPALANATLVVDDLKEIITLLEKEEGVEKWSARLVAQIANLPYR